MVVENMERDSVFGGSRNSVRNCLFLNFKLYEKYKFWFIKLLIVGF